MNGPPSDDIGGLSRSELEEHARSLRAVVSVSDAVHLSSDFSDLVERADDAIVTYTCYPSVGLFRVNYDQARVELVAIRGFGDEVVASVQTLPLEGSLTGEAVRARAVVTTHDLAANDRLEPRTRRALEQEGFVYVSTMRSTRLFLGSDAGSTIGSLEPIASERSCTGEIPRRWRCSTTARPRRRLMVPSSL